MKGSVSAKCQLLSEVRECSAKWHSALATLDRSRQATCTMHFATLHFYAVFASRFTRRDL